MTEDVAIGDLLRRVREPVQIEDDIEYRQVTVGLNHRGVRLRGVQRGAEIKTKQQYRARAGQFILSRIDARNAAFGLIPDGLDGAIVTNDFPVFEVAAERVLPDYFHALTQSDAFLDACVRASSGTTNRQRLSEAAFLAYRFKVPSLAEQAARVAHLDRVLGQAAEVSARLDAQAADVAALRRAVLDDAIRGRLTEQDPTDEPASALLARIADERARRAKAEGRKPPKTLPPVAEDEQPFPLPDGWAWARLGHVSELWNGRAYSKHELLSAGTPVLRIQNLSGGKSWYYSDLALPETKYCNPGDLLYAWSTSFGPYRWEGPRAIFHYHIWRVEPIGGVDQDYLFCLLQNLTLSIRDHTRGSTMVHVTKNRMEQFVVPVPPLEEQRRIVARVEEMTAHCDRLAAAVSGARAEAGALAAAALRETLAA